jgi:hypothetical protein
MPKLQLVIPLMALMAVIIIGLAVYLFVNYSGIGITQGIILIAVAAVVLLVVMGIMILVMRSAANKK